MFILDPDVDFLPIPDPGVKKKALDPESTGQNGTGSWIPDPKHWLAMPYLS
jgi:hypothetical protein